MSTDHAQRIWEICRECGSTVHGLRPPTPAYADRTARMLFLIAAQESGLRWERQRTPRWDGAVGGFSKWQLETGSITDSLLYLQRQPQVLTRATQFLFADRNATTDWPRTMSLDAILWAMRLDDNDKIGCLFARLHLFRDPEAIPATVPEQADYWLRKYNVGGILKHVPGATLAEKRAAALREVESNWYLYCAPVVGA